MKFLITLAAAFITIAATAQTEQDTITMGKTKVIVIKDENDSTDVAWEDNENNTKLENTHWAGIDFGVNVLMNKDNSTNLGAENKWLELDYSQSMSVRFNFLEQKIRIYKDYVGLLVGAGVSFNSYGLKNNVQIVSNTTEYPDTTFGAYIPDTLRNFTKNKLRAAYLQLPLMVEFNTNEDPKKSFHLAAGIIGGWKVGSMTKQKYEEDNSQVKLKVRDDFNLTPFTLDLTARVGYRNFTLFGTYGLTPLFQDDKGPEVYPVTLGVSFIPFG